MATNRDIALRKLEALSSRVEEHLTKITSHPVGAAAVQGAPAELDRLLTSGFDEFRQKNHRWHAQRRQEFVFHMTDWLADLKRLVDLYRHPRNFDTEAACRLVAGFLYHVIPHITAAGRLLLDEIPDPFGETDREP
jgi:hypothetical protein